MNSVQTCQSFHAMSPLSSGLMPPPLWGGSFAELNDAEGLSPYLSPSLFKRTVSTASNMARHNIRGLRLWNRNMTFEQREWPERPLERVKKRLSAYIPFASFISVHALINWDIHGGKNLIGALAMAEREGRGVIGISNHQSLFDDPLLYIAIINIFNPSYAVKCWRSTADKHNFNPAGESLRARLTRAFFKPCNMIYLERKKKRNGRPPSVHDNPLIPLSQRLDDRTLRTLAQKAKGLGVDIKTYLQSYLTQGKDGIVGDLAAINQIGLLEAIASADGGGWVHMFPEGTRSRTIHLEEPKPGVGKVIYHARDAIVVPFAFHGMHKVSPTGALGLIPRPFNTVVVNVGRPISPHKLKALRAGPPTMKTFAGLSNIAMSAIHELRPFVLRRYYGADVADVILRQEATRTRSDKASDLVGLNAVGYNFNEGGIEGKRSGRVQVEH